jgi:hypothetical protein
MEVALYTQSAGTKDFHSLKFRSYIYRCWVALKTRDRYPLVINPYIYTHTHLSVDSPRFSKNQVLGWLQGGLSTFQSQRTGQRTFWFFDENCQFFEIVEMIRIDRQFFDSEMFKELELGSWFFKSSKNRPRLVFISHIIHSLVSTIPYL